MTLRRLVLATAFVIAGWLAFMGDKSPQSTIVEPTARGTSTQKGAAVASPIQPQRLLSRKVDAEPMILAIVDRQRLIGGAHGSTSPSNLFASQTWKPPPTPPPPPSKPVPPPPPMAPPLPYVFLGKKSEDGKWEVYLARGEQTYIAREQSIIEGQYRIDAIKPPTLSLTYLPLSQQQTLTIGGLD